MGGTRGTGRQAERTRPDAEAEEAGTQRDDGGREAQVALIEMENAALKKLKALVQEEEVRRIGSRPK